jgi:hypothetical protein
MKHGNVIISALIGALIGFCIPHQGDVVRSPSRGYFWDQANAHQRLINHTIGGTLIGMTVGIAVDLLVNGRPKFTFRFSLKTLLGFVFAASVISFIVRCYLHHRIDPFRW